LILHSTKDFTLVLDGARTPPHARIIMFYAMDVIKFMANTQIMRKTKMQEKVLSEAEKICEEIFPEDEVSQCLLHHHLAVFADFVEVQSLLRFREELKTCSSPYSLAEDLRHG
jgi:hypothetical protein